MTNFISHLPRLSLFKSLRFVGALGLPALLLVAAACSSSTSPYGSNSGAGGQFISPSVPAESALAATPPVGSQ